MTTRRNNRQKRFKPGCHPDSLANLKRQNPLYGTRKVNFSIGLTPETRAKLKLVAEANNFSVSELVERVTRALSMDDIQKLISSP